MFCQPMDIVISWKQKRYSVRLFLKLFVGGLMSYLPYLCLYWYSGVRHILCCVFVLFSSSCVTCVASFSGLSILIAPSVFPNVNYENIFSLIFDTGISPEAWLIGNMIPIFKEKQR